MTLRRRPYDSISAVKFPFGGIRAASPVASLSEALRPVSVPRGVTTPCQDPSPRIRALWFSRSLDERREACRRCRLCPIVHTCGEAAEANQERHGVWGGKDFTKGDRPRRKGAA